MCCVTTLLNVTVMKQGESLVAIYKPSILIGLPTFHALFDILALNTYSVTFNTTLCGDCKTRSLPWLSNSSQ